jgi:hypothetical protein
MKTTSKRSALFTVMVIVLLRLSSFGIAGVISFSGADISTYFTQTGANVFTTTGSGGISNSSAIAIDSTSTRGALVTQTGFQGGQSTPSFNLSVYFLFTSFTSTATGYMLTLGITSFPDFDVVADNRTDDEMFVDREGFISPPHYLVTNMSYSNGSGGCSPDPVTLLDGNWYQMSLAGTWNASTGRYDIQFRLNNADANGNLGTVLWSNTASSTIDTSGTVYAFVAADGPSKTMGVSAIDNFTYSPITTVPEPSTWAMLLGGFGSLLMFRRQR